MGKIIAHVIAAKGKHRERIVAQLSHLAFCCSCHFGRDGGAEKDTVLPSQSFVDERNDRGSSASENDG